MARQLWLLRHADAEPHGTRPDAERRLTARGERQSRLAGQALERLGIEFERILSSPKERALLTATLALEAWHERTQGGPSPSDLEVHDPLSSGFDGHQALAAVAELEADGRLLVVGHEPDLSSVVAQLTSARIDLKKGGLAVVRLPAIAPSAATNGQARRALADGRSAGAAGELVLLLSPLELALIADVVAVRA
jgi:phosphohistidine phosphatase